MKISITILFISLLFFTFSFGQDTKMSVQGAVQVADYENETPEVGMIRFNTANGDFEGWNGLYWASLTGIQQFGTLTDADGNEYKTIRIGAQEWMAENLRTTKYSNGDNIAHIIDGTEWSNLSTGAWCWYDNDSSFEHPYGKLYNWYAVDDNRGLCPTGWRVPSTEFDWSDLELFLNPQAGGKMKAKGTLHWNAPNIGATNASGFTGLSGGLRQQGGLFSQFGDYGNWRSSEELSDSGASEYVYLRNQNTSFRINVDISKEAGLSIRCMRDVDETPSAMGFYEEPTTIEKPTASELHIQKISLRDVQLQQNSPNPFQESTNIAYYVPKNIRQASIRISDHAGKILDEVEITQKGAGRLDIYAAALSEGQYFYSLVLDGEIYETKQMILER